MKSQLCTSGNLKNIMSVKKAVVEYTQYDFIYIKFKTRKSEQYIVKNKTWDDSVSNRKGRNDKHKIQGRG